MIWIPYALIGGGVFLSLIDSKMGRALVGIGTALAVPLLWRGAGTESAFLTLTAVLGVSTCVSGWKKKLSGVGASISILAVILFIEGTGEWRVTAYELYALGTFLLVLKSNAVKTARRYLVTNQVFGVIPMILAYSTGYAPLYLSAFLFRAGVFPFHRWVPEVYSRIRSSLAPVLIMGDVMAFYGILELHLGSIWGYPLALLGSVSTFSTLYSLREIKLKRKFSYNGVMDVGVAFFGLGSYMVTGQLLLMAGAILHLIYQAIYRASTFIGLGSVEHYGEEPNVCSVRKLFKNHVMSVLISLSALSMAGVPPLASFVSRWLMYQGMMGADLPLWLMFLPMVLMGALPLASMLQIRNLSRRICGRVVDVGGVPAKITMTTAGLVTLGLTSPAVLLVVYQRIYGELSLLPAILSALFLIAVAGLGWKIGNAPTEKVSELLLIFYSVGDIMKETWAFFVDVGRVAYLRHLVPLVKVIPRSEVPLIKKSEEAMDYETRHVDEAMFRPLLWMMAKASEWGHRRNPDMNSMMTGFALILALLIVLGVLMR